MEYKIAMLGDTGVGKTCLITRYVHGTFNINQSSSSSASFMKKYVKVDGDQIKLQIWDTAGQETFKTLAPLYYRSAAAAIIVFDVTRSKSFDEVKYWADQVALNGGQNIKIVIVGNQIDRENRTVSKANATQFAKQVGAEYYETSAYTGEGVDQIFSDLAKSKLEAKQEGQIIVGYVKESNKVKCCK